MISSGDLFDSNIVVENGTALINLQKKEMLSKDAKWNVKVMSKIHPDGVAIFDSGMTQETSFSVTLQSEGLYLLFYYVVEGNMRYPHVRKSFYFYSDKKNAEYKEWFDSYRDLKNNYKISANNNLPLYYMEYITQKKKKNI